MRVIDRFPAPPPVTVNAVKIPAAVIAREIQNHPALSVSEARQAAVEALVVRELLLQEARRLRLKAEPEALEGGTKETGEDALLRRLLEQEVKVPSPTDAECLRYYRVNEARFRSPELHQVCHILFAADPEDQAARSDAETAARQAIEELHGHPERFAALAASLSACPSGTQGGNLGQVSPGQTVPEFEEALKTLKPGAICRQPVATRYGFHVVRLDRRIAGRAVPFENVKEKIADYLSDRVFHRAVRQYVLLLAGRARIEGAEIARSDNPLVQ